MAGGWRVSGSARIRLHIRPRLRRIGETLFRDWLATALGNHIWAWRPLSEGELAHEVAHVHQWRRHGAAFPVLYLLASLRAWKAGQDWYADNEFERAARAGRS
jgi:hypothetical protein